MMLPSNKFDWRNLWADLLQGVGAGLLEHDGSRIAQAALAGLSAFDAAQERRRRREAQGPGHGEYSRSARHLAAAWPEMSDVERAAFLRSTPEERAAFLAEMAGPEPQEAPPFLRSRPDMTGGDAAPETSNGFTARPYPGARRRPASANPFDGWPMEAALPFRTDGRLKFPLRR